MRVSPFALAAVLATIGLSATSAAAAPQILGVVASMAPMPLACKDQTCTAQLSAFCLQRERDVPPGWTVYHAADPGAFILTATRADGSSVRIPLDERIGFTSAFGFASARVTVPAALLEEWQAVALAIEVSPSAVLVPMPVAGDSNPQSEAEIALATGPLRQVASRHFDSPSTERDAAQLVEAMVNGFPVHSWEGRVDRAAVWERQVTPALKEAASPKSIALARSIYEKCLPQSYGMRQCLELKHMNLLSDATRAYWAEAVPGG
ncbi:MAG TPA: hypothetical protein VED46_16235 [Alphaproteobacteria bacterium]|nr:hypothetical protein [Alphaproteobacteria bacterium]